MGQRCARAGPSVHCCLARLYTTLPTSFGCGWSYRRARSFFEKVWRAVGESALGALTDASGEFFDVIEDLTPLGHLGQDLSLRVHDGGVVTAERLADLG
jgi:hypothetical protein